MNLKRISSGVIASMLLVGNVAFAEEVNTIENKSDRNEVSSEKNNKGDEKEDKAAIKAAIAKNVKNDNVLAARSDVPEIKLGEKIDITIPYIYSYACKFKVSSKGLVTVEVDIPDQLRDSSSSLHVVIKDEDGKNRAYEYIEGKSFSGEDAIILRTGLEPGEHELRLSGVCFRESTPTKMKVSFEKYNNVELEPNDYRADATEINLGGVYKGSMTRLDTDVFKLVLNEDTKVRVEVQEGKTVNKEGNLRLELAPANGGWDAIRRQHKGKYVYEMQFKKGVNYIEVDNYSGLTDYTLKASKVTGPLMPMMNSIGDNHEKITGETEVGTKVYIKIGSKAYQQANVDRYGDFILKTGKIKEGTQVNAYAVDSRGVKGNVGVAHVFDSTPPAPPKVNQFTLKSTTVSGVTEANALVKCSVDSSSWDMYETVADSKGKFSFNVGKLRRGDVIYVNAVDAEGNQSNSTKIIVQNYVAPPKVNNFSNINVNVTGTGPKGSTVYVKAANKYYKGKVDSAGKFSIKIPKQKYKSVLKLYAKASNGDKSSIVSKTVGYAPKKPVVNSVTTKSVKITGKSSKNANITVKIGSKYYTGKTTSKGNFSIKIPKCKKGTKIKVQAKFAKTGLKSYATTITVK